MPGPCFAEGTTYLAESITGIASLVRQPRKHGLVLAYVIGHCAISDEFLEAGGERGSILRIHGGPLSRNPISQQLSERSDDRDRRRRDVLPITDFGRLPVIFRRGRRLTSREQVSHARLSAAASPTRGELTYHESTQRQDLFWLGSQAAISALTAGAIGGGELFAQRKPQPPPGSLEQRVAVLLQAFDAQGNHRTATEVDTASAQWLAHEARLAGAEVSLEPFSLSRVDPESCYLRIGEDRIEAVPLFDAGFTGPEGVEGAIGPLGSEAEIALVESETAETGDYLTQRPDEVAERAAAGIKRSLC